MKHILSWFVLIVSIAVIVSSCRDIKWEGVENGSPDNSSDNSTSTADNSTSSSSDNSSSANPKVFVAVGNSGNIVRSTDNGSSWDNATSPTTKNLLGVSFGNNTFVAVGNSGNIVRSTNNGSSWDNVTSPTGNAIYGVTFYE